MRPSSIANDLRRQSHLRPSSIATNLRRHSCVKTKRVNSNQHGPRGPLSAEGPIREIYCFLVGKASLDQEKQIPVCIREVVGNCEAKIIQVCCHVAPGVSVGRHVVGESGGGRAQTRTESRKTVLIVGWASRTVLEEMPWSWGLGYGIVET